MINVQEITAQFNNKVEITNNTGQVNVNGGLILTKEFLR